MFVQYMNVIPSLIAAGPKSFFNVEYLYSVAYSVALSGDRPVATEEETTASFIVGCYTLMLCGSIQLITNKWSAKDTHQWWMTQGSLDVAIQGGSVNGLTLVTVGNLALFVLKNLSSLLYEIFWTSLRYLCLRLCVPSSSPKMFFFSVSRIKLIIFAQGSCSLRHTTRFVRVILDKI